MWPLWAAERLQFDRNTATLTARGQNTSVEVPAGEWWMPVSSFGGIFGFADVGTQVKLALTIKQISNNPGFHIPYAESPLTTSAFVGELFHVPFMFPNRVLYPAGTLFAVRASEYVPTIGPDTIEFGILYWQLKA